MSVNIYNLFGEIAEGRLTFKEVCEHLEHKIDQAYQSQHPCVISSVEQSILYDHLPRLLPGFFNTPEEGTIPANLAKAIDPIDMCRWIVILTQLEVSDNDLRSELTTDTSMMLTHMAENLPPENITFILSALPVVADENTVIGISHILRTLEPHLIAQTQEGQYLSRENIVQGIYSLRMLSNSVQVDNILMALLPHVEAHKNQGGIFNLRELTQIFRGLNGKNFSPAIIALLPYLIYNIDAAKDRGELFSEAMLQKIEHSLGVMLASEKEITDEETSIIFKELKLAIDRNIKYSEESQRFLAILQRPRASYIF